MSTERAVGALAALLLLSGCPGSLENPEQFLGECFDPPTDLFPQRCALSDCHSPEDRAGELDLGSPDVETRVVGVEADGGDGIIVDPNAPEQSILYIKVSSDNPPFGTRMPQTGRELSSYERQCVLEWIQGLSPPGET